MGKALKRIIAILLFLPLFWLTDSKVYADGFYYPPDTDGELVIVIDPGHGGNNSGAEYNGFIEKEMTMIVANAMYEELSKYEDVTVYLTHTSADTSMEIQARADFAASVNADFLFCLHFNTSPGNKLFGSEVWISAFGEENRQGYAFGRVQMETMQEMGLFLRGIKTKLQEDGADYYGILRFCEEYDIPAALIEHCHIDHEADMGFCDSEEDLIAFGVADATAVAKFFGLRSEELQVDYSNLARRYEQTGNGGSYAVLDTTDPDICRIETAYVDKDRHLVGITVTGHDEDTPMLYYSYSIDGGITYTPYIAWPQTDVLAGSSPDVFTFEILVPTGISPMIVVRGINQYDRYTESNLLSGFPVFVGGPEEAIPPEGSVNMPGEEDMVSQGNAGGGFHAPELPWTESERGDFLYFLQFCLLMAGVLFIELFITNMILSARKRHKRKKRHKR